MARHNPSRIRPCRIGRSGLGAVALSGLLLAGCASDAPQDTFKAEGPRAEQIKDLAIPIGIVAIVVGIIVGIALLLVVVKFRDKGDGRTPKQTHGNTKLEIAWTIAPAVLLAAIAVPTITTIFDLDRKPDNPLEVAVIGQQWWWEFNYNDNGIITANEMVIPVDTDVYLSITSRDVIHSFWIPRLAGKKDAVPGRVHKLNIRADKPGDYWGQCTEFCGLSHANMRIRVRALSKDDFATWEADQTKPYVAPTDEALKRGEAAFVAKCASCHQVNGMLDSSGKPIVVDASASLIAGAAPNLTHFASRSTFAGATWPTYLDDPSTPANEADPYAGGAVIQNREQLEAWLRDPPKELPMAADEKRGMPKLGLSEQEIDDLADYLYSLK